MANFIEVMQEAYNKEGDANVPLDLEKWKKEWLTS